MKKTIILLTGLILLTSCNSTNKKSTNIAQNQEKSTLQESIKRGKLVYNDMCTTCHLPDGKGVPKVFPPLADSDYLRDNQVNSIKAVKYGLSGEILVNNITYNSIMSPLGLSNQEVADVINYINNSWGNKIDNVATPEKVSEL
ncbi:cytochrome c [Winogradskyella litoriviva]|uniref:Cytochrome c n=1 Tax=Winogradskyella litoriviva TaxID=1220182 RepID=A0ABX2E3F5_9FLAO|nr:cytochrome c [Winogradskyella litoriviva]NRD22772.1 cytochrome c [Winogradskyella litoriviva]